MEMATQSSEFVAGLIIADAEMKVVAADRMFIDGIGHPCEELEGRLVSEVLGAPKGTRDALESVTEENEVGRLYTRRVSPSGLARTLRVSWSPLKLEGGKRGVMLTVEDLSPALH